MAGVAVAAFAAVIIGWNVWRTWPAPGSSGAPAESASPSQPQAKLDAAGPGAPASTEPQAGKPQASKPEASKPAAGTAQKPQFDVVRVEPSGETVVAGRAAPNAKITLFSAGKPLGQVTANSEGQFVILPPALPPGDHLLSLEADAVASDQTVAIAVPKPGGRDVVVALAEPDKPTRILSDAQPAKKPDAAAPGGTIGVTIRSVEAQQGGGFFMSGVASAGAKVRLYLNDAFIALAEAGADGRWSIRVEKGMSAGKYAVRADLLGQDGGVAARAEVPFDYPASSLLAAAPSGKRNETAPAAPSASPSEPAATPAATAAPAKRTGQPETAPSPTVVPELRTAKVERGDSLWRISRTVLGQGVRYTQIYDANTDQIRNPNRIYPGQVLVVPNSKP